MWEFMLHLTVSFSDLLILPKFYGFHFNKMFSSCQLESLKREAIVELNDSSSSPAPAEESDSSGSEDEVWMTTKNSKEHKNS